jgi:hypothetical protein
MNDFIRIRSPSISLFGSAPNSDAMACPTAPAGCAKLDVELETEASFREAIDMVVSGNWEPDRGLDRPDPRRRYETYIPPIKEAA